MNASWNEVSALAAKAARGAGAPPAQAAAFGRAAAFHLAQNQPEDDLRRALDAVPNGAILDLPLALQTILTQRQGETAQGHIPSAPHGGALARSYIAMMPFASTVSQNGDQITVTFDLTQPAPPMAPSRITLQLDLYYEMQALAARTFVPETAASRISGAGAGLTDND